MLQPHRVVNFFPRYLSSIDVSKIFPWEQKRESIFSQLSISEKKKKNHRYAIFCCCSCYHACLYRLFSKKIRLWELTRMSYEFLGRDKTHTTVLCRYRQKNSAYFISFLHRVSLKIRFFYPYTLMSYRKENSELEYSLARQSELQTFCFLHEFSYSMFSYTKYQNFYGILVYLYSKITWLSYKTYTAYYNVLCNFTLLMHL